MYFPQKTSFFFLLKLSILASGAAVSSSKATSAPSSAAASSTSSSSTSTLSATDASNPSSIPVTTVGFAPLESNGPIFPLLTDPKDMVSAKPPDPIRDMLGAIIDGPQNVPIQFENPDLLAPPTTDEGSVGNAKWPFSLSHNRIHTGGWARQQNVNVMPIATAMAGVNMRLRPGAVRELHWHSTAEWAYVIKGSVRVSVVTPESQSYLADVHPGDLWYFPPGYPHSLQALNDTGADGSEFLLVFDSGEFSEDSTFQLTDWLAHVPKEALARNFDADLSVFDHLPGKELYIFPTDVPGPLEDIQKEIRGPGGDPPDPFSYSLSKVKPIQLEGGTVKITDSTTFKVSKTIASAEVTVEPGAIRELHWHPTEPEWSYFISGKARVTLFASSGNARTFDYSAGDVGYVPPSFGHYVENIGNETLKYLEIFKSDRYEDLSLQQWLALTPPELVRAHLNLETSTISQFNKTKGIVVGGM